MSTFCAKRLPPVVLFTRASLNFFIFTHYLSVVLSNYFAILCYLSIRIKAMERANNRKRKLFGQKKKFELG